MAKKISKRFAQSNIDGTRRLYYKRFLYQNTVKQLAVQNPHIMNFNFGEKFLFGRVDRYHSPMILKSDRKVKQFNSISAAGDESMLAVDFVVDAFNDMKIDFKKAVAIGQIMDDDEFLSEPKVFKAFVEPRDKYAAYNRNFNTQIKRRFTTRSIIVKNFLQFMNDFKSILLTSGEGVRRYPYTLPAYLKSRLCPINCSGLAIEIADLKASDDDQKVSFITHPNWPFFVNACNKNGFMIDQNVPWRLVADIDAPVMRTRAGASSTSNLINNYYNTGWGRYYGDFKARLLTLYNEIKNDAYHEISTCDDGSTINKIGRPVQYTIGDLNDLFSEEYFMRVYFDIRFAEEESSFTDAEKRSLINQIISVHRADNHPTSAIYIFERILNKTFDYNGSISYIINKRRLIREAELSEYGIGEDRPSILNGGGY